MGACRVYQGKGNPNKRHMRGSLVQTVSRIPPIPFLILWSNKFPVVYYVPMDDLPYSSIPNRGCRAPADTPE